MERFSWNWVGRSQVHEEITICSGQFERVEQGFFWSAKRKAKSILNEIANFDAIEQGGGLTSELLVQRALRKGELEELIFEGKNSLETKS